MYPRESETREVKNLSGIWSFKLDKEGCGRKEEWFTRPLEETRLMPVPASYNDVTQEAEIRDHIGEVWYERTFFVPTSWSRHRVVVRIGAASHHSTVWINGQEVARHKGGFLPFEADISERIDCGEENRITIAVDNILDWSCLPPGEIKTFSAKTHPAGHRILEYHHDFFNYAGIHRPVVLYTTPKQFISDMTVTTDISGSSGLVNYRIDISDDADDVHVRLLDAQGDEVANGNGTCGDLTVDNAHLWAPGKPYLYMLEARVRKEADVYRLPVGIRAVEVTEKEFLINGKSFYFRGFGKHEDSDIRGKGGNHAVNVKDFNLLKWIGANSFRTSHYPYSDEIMDLADREGIVIVDEVPAVGFHMWNLEERVFRDGRVDENTLAHHLEVIRELIARDKNHPCVVMWSVGNEAATYEEASEPYFEAVIREAKRLDPTRPVALVECVKPHECHTAHLPDVIGLNRYNSWYEDSGHLGVVEHQLEPELREWHERFGKPVLMTEYGADTVAGFHGDPPLMFTEEYQCEMLARFHNVFDRLDFVIGEHVWNFADFATKQGTTRVLGNRKGVFTRQRQPKAAAHLLRKRWK